MILLLSKTPHVVTVLWLDSDNVVTIRSPTSGTSGILQNSRGVFRFELDRGVPKTGPMFKDFL